MTSQVVQRARPLSGRIWLLGRQRVKTQFPSKGNYERFIDVFLSVTKTNRMVYQKMNSIRFQFSFLLLHTVYRKRLNIRWFTIIQKIYI